MGEDRQEKERGLSKEGEDDSSMLALAGKKADEKAWEKNCGNGKYGNG